MAINLLFFVLATSFISGVLGMAGGLILMGALLFYTSVATAMILHGYVQLIANANRAWQIRSSIYWPSILPYFLGILISLAVFLAIQMVLEKHYVYIFLGILPFVSLLPIFPRLDFQNKRHALSAGILTTALQLTCGVNGPLLDIYFLKTQLNRFQIVATKAFTQAISHFSKICYFLYVAVDLSDLKSLDPIWYLAVIPTSVLGTFLDIKVLHKMNDKSFLRSTRYVVCVIGAYYIYKGLTW